jgi:hypothetical protein
MARHEDEVSASAADTDAEVRRIVFGPADIHRVRLTLAAVGVTFIPTLTGSAQLLSAIDDLVAKVKKQK